MTDGVFAPPTRRTEPLSAQQLQNAEAALRDSLTQLQSLINQAFGTPAKAGANTFDATRAAGQTQVPASLATFAQGHGFEPNEIAALGQNGLTTAINAQQALGRGDWAGALNLASTLGSNAGDTMKRLTMGAMDAIPAEAQRVLGNAGFTFAQVRNLGTQLPKAYAAADALARGDWKAAAGQALALEGVAPDAAARLGQAVAARLPQAERSALKQLGLSDNAISSLGARIPYASLAAKALGSGDWKTAAKAMDALSGGQAGAWASQAAQPLQNAILNRLPADVRQGIQNLGLDPAAIKGGLASAGDAVAALQKGDWKAAANALGTVDDPNAQAAITGAVNRLVPASVKESLQHAGLDANALGGALPQAADAVAALDKGDWKTAAAGLAGLPQKIGDTLQRAVLGVIPKDIKDAFDKVGFNKADLKELGAALPRALDAAKAVGNGDWKGAAAALGAIGDKAPNATRKLGLAVNQLIPADVKTALGKLGIDGVGLGELRTALPDAIDAAQALAKGDWKGALQGIQAVGQDAPHLTDKVTQAISDALPQDVKDALGKTGITGQDIKELGAALPVAVDAAQAIGKGDWRAAAQNIGVLGQVAPDLTAKLHQQLDKVLPDDVKKIVGDIGTTAGEMGAALPAAIDAFKAVQKGDWRAAAKDLDALKQAAPRATAFITDKLDKALPADVKKKLGQLGTTATELGSALPSAIDTVDAIKKGDWKAAAAGIGAVKQAAPQTVAFLDKQLDKIVPADVKEKLGTIGTDVAEAGAALPAITGALDALKKGDWQAAAKNFDGIKDAAPHVVQQITNAWDKFVPQGVKDALAPLGVAAQDVWKLGSKLTDAVDFAGKLKQGDGVAALGALEKVVGDPNLGKKIEGSLGLPEGGLNAALQKGLINLGGLQLSGFAGDQNIPDGKVQNDLKLGGQTLAGGQFKVGGSVFSAQGKIGKEGDLVQAEGSVKLLQAELYGSGSVKADWKNLTFGATGRIGAKLNLLEAEGKAKLDYGWGSTEATGHVNVGATAQAEGTVKFDPKHLDLAAEVDGEAFAGVQAGATLKQRIGPVAVEGRAAVSAGVGVQFGLDVGLQNGKLGFKMDIGAALGIGFDLSFGFSIDVKQIIQGAGKLLAAPAKFIGDAIKKAGEGVAWLGNKVIDGAKKVGEAVVDGAKKVGGAIVDGVKSVGHAIGKIFHGW
ncbi:MAG TPA: hypothetical protein VFA20_30320 [Myxococcaceae bacterium]|nr:hypothetical protein [Myxococcaceae bacterium]